MGKRGKKKRTLEQIALDDKAAKLAKKDNKEKKDRVYCNECTQYVEKICTNHINCFHNQMQ